ncbi:hypothetical protein BKA62DRAFT_804740 [Auriculariales sp. MPI-PUGE-AT-0066]|nr:hypothetical protein BKA62DRAFT_804740 [Auriculariales sp. MPI-PUGE-AT-0066]
MRVGPLFTLAACAATAYGQSTFATCLTSAKLSPDAEVVFPSDATYADAIAVVTLEFSYKPAAVVFLGAPEDATVALQCAAQFGVPTVSRCGRHSYASFSVGGQDGSLVLDTTKLKAITYDKKTGLATIGLGNRLGDVALALDSWGRGTPHGTCASVGTGGHANCGGFGMWSREHGMFLDQIVKARVATANGTIVTASHAENSDLFWAIRGAGPSFGTVLSITIKTYAQPSSVVRFNYTFPVVTEVNTLVNCFLAFQSFAATDAPPPLGIRILWTPLPTGAQVWIHGLYYGPQAAFLSATKPLLDSLPVEPIEADIYDLSYIEAVKVIDTTGQLNSTGRPLQAGNTYFQSVLVPNGQPMSLETWTAYAEYALNTPLPADYLAFTEIDAFAGLYKGRPTAISAIPENAAAFSNRNSMLLMQLGSLSFGADYTDEMFAWARGWRAAITDSVAAENGTVKAYGCYVDAKWTAKEAHSVYFGPAKTTKLDKIKQRWDPKRVFNYPHGF